MEEPSFIIAGAPRCGTTTLYEYLSEHPEVFMSPVKEPHYFAFSEGVPPYAGPEDVDRLERMAVTDVSEYRALFAGAGQAAVTGEASTMYLYMDGVAEEIRRHRSDVRIIVLLRDPVERAYSAYKHMVRDGRERASSFGAALRRESDRIENGWAPNWYYVRVGMYASQLTQYFETFGREQVRVFLFGDFVDHPGRVLSNIYEFLGVEPSHRPDSLRAYNRSGRPRSRMLTRFLESDNVAKKLTRRLLSRTTRRRLKDWLRSLNLREGDDIDSRIRGELYDFYRDDIERLEDLLSVDLSHWKRRS